MYNNFVYNKQKLVKMEIRDIVPKNLINNENVSQGNNSCSNAQCT